MTYNGLLCPCHKDTRLPCVNPQILKLQDARLIAGNELTVILQYTQAAVLVSLASVV